jgi:hypothetical protein
MIRSDAKVLSDGIFSDSRTCDDCVPLSRAEDIKNIVAKALEVDCMVASPREI